MTKRKPIDSDEIQVFRDAVKDVRPLRHEQAEPFRQRRRPQAFKPAAAETEDLQRSFPELLAASQLEAEEYLLFSRPGVQQRLLHDLRRGRIGVEYELDLHGLTSSHARAMLVDFFSECRRRRIRCVQIVHGKGYGSQDGRSVLKQKLNFWLRQREEVLAFCSALPRDGGSGAMYVLLSRKRSAPSR
jgi:DNA-nicking Smr family endonuclease